MKTFSLSLDIDVAVDEYDLWPDGDGPKNPTIEDVKKLIDECGGAKRVIYDWDLVTYFDKFFVREIVIPTKKEEP